MFESNTNPLGSPTTSFGPINRQGAVRAQRVPAPNHRGGLFGSLYYGVREFVGVFIDAINGRYDR